MTRDLILIAVDRATGEVMEAGKPSGLQIVPKTVNEKMFEVVPQSTWYALLSASRVDLTKAEFPLPKRYEEHPYDTAEERIETSAHNACLDAITAQMKGE